MTSILHSKAQGLRVHKLANLGGLVAIAGLENLEPTLLLGALMEMARQLPHLSLEHTKQLCEQGIQKLRERNSEKRVYKQQKNSELSSIEITLKINEIKKLIVMLGGKTPVLEKDLIPELLRLMR